MKCNFLSSLITNDLACQIYKMWGCKWGVEFILFSCIRKTTIDAKRRGIAAQLKCRMDNTKLIKKTAYIAYCSHPKLTRLCVTFLVSYCLINRRNGKSLSALLPMHILWFCILLSKEWKQVAEVVSRNVCIWNKFRKFSQYIRYACYIV